MVKLGNCGDIYISLESLKKHNYIVLEELKVLQQHLEILYLRAIMLKDIYLSPLEANYIPACHHLINRRKETMQTMPTHERKP